MPKGAKGFQKKAVAVSGKVQHASEVPASSEILEVVQVLAPSQPGVLMAQGLHVNRSSRSALMTAARRLA